MRLSKQFLCIFAFGLIAVTSGRSSHGMGWFDGCDDDCDAGMCDIDVCDGDTCDGTLTSRIRSGPVPGMFGDGGLLIPRVNVRRAGLQIVHQNHAYKVAENNSALPQDRIGFNLNAMQDVFNGQIDGRVNDSIYEYRLFGEKSFLHGRFSVDFMVPFYTTSSLEYEPLDVVENGPGTHGAFGDLAFGFKVLVHESRTSAYSLGLRIEAPTGEEPVSPPSLEFFYRSLDDDVWHFTPYVAGLWAPSERTFIQSFLSYRLTSSNIRELEQPLSIREQSYFMADVSVGYWLYRNRCGSCLTGLAPMLELHYTGAWDDESSFNDNLGPLPTDTKRFYGRSDRLSLTAGMTAFLGSRCSAGIGIAAPLRSESTTIDSETIDTDRAYDWALLTQLTYHFGR